jgi:hypothetical protein
MREGTAAENLPLPLAGETASAPARITMRENARRNLLPPPLAGEGWVGGRALAPLYDGVGNRTFPTLALPRKRGREATARFPIFSGGVG